MSTKESSPVAIDGNEDVYRRRSTRRRIPKIDWDHEDGTASRMPDGTTQDGRSKPSNKKSHSKGFSSTSKVAERKKKIVDGFKDSSQRINSERKRYDKGKSSSSKTAAPPPIMAAAAGVDTGFVIPPSIFNDIPDIDLCPLKETITARKRHNRQISLSSPATKVRKVMKHSDGCSSNSGSGSETSYTDGIESDLLHTDDTRIRSSRKDTRTSSPAELGAQIDEEYLSFNETEPPSNDGSSIDSKLLVPDVSCIESDVRLWEKDLGPNSTAPPILWALDNIPEKLNENKEWIAKIEDILLEWNSLPHSTKFIYMNKASKNQSSAAKVSPSLRKENTQTNTAVIDEYGTTSTSTTPISCSITKDIDLSTSRESTSTAGAQSPMDVVTPPITTTSLYNIPVPLLAATLMANNVSFPLLPSQGGPSSHLPLPHHIMPFPMSSPITPNGSIATDSGGIMTSFSNALKLFATVPFTMSASSGSSSSSLVSSAVLPIVKVENPGCSSGGTSNHLIQPLSLQSVTRPPVSYMTTGPFPTTPLQNITGTPQTTSMPPLVNGIPQSSTITTACNDPINSHRPLVNSSFSMNNILGASSRGLVFPGTSPLETTPSLLTPLPLTKPNDNAQVPTAKQTKKKKRWSIYRIKENPPLMSVNSKKAPVAVCTAQSIQLLSPPVTNTTCTAAGATSLTNCCSSLSAATSVVNSSTCSFSLSTRSPTCISSISLETISSSQQFSSSTASTSNNDLSLVSDDWKRTLEKQLRERNTFKKKKLMAASTAVASLHDNNNQCHVQIPKKNKRLKNAKKSSMPPPPCPMAASSPTLLLSPSMEQSPFMRNDSASPVQQQSPFMSAHQHHPLSRSSSSTSFTSPIDPHNIPHPFPSPAVTSNNHHPFRYPGNHSSLRGSSTSPMTGLVSPSAAAYSPVFPANSLLSSSDSNLKLFDSSTSKGMNLSLEDQSKLDAHNYANLERQYWRLLIAFEEQKKSIANMKERMMKARIEQQILLLNNEKFNQLKDLVVNPILDPSVPDLLESPLKNSTVSNPSNVRLKGTFDKPVLENEDIYKYLLQSLS